MISQQLDSWEERAIKLALACDRPATPLVDLLLLGLFQYAYLYGLSSATVRPVTTRRQFALCFLEHGCGGVRRWAGSLPASDVYMESGVLYPLLKRFTDASILGENCN